MNPKEKILYHSKGIDILKVLLINKVPRNKLKISKEINATYSYTCKTLKKMEEIGLIKLIPIDKRSSIIKLTEKGREIALKLKTIELWLGN